MEKSYEIAGIELEIRIPEDKMYEEENVLTPFRKGVAADPHRFFFDLIPTLEPPFGTCVVAKPALQVYVQQDRTVWYIGSVDGHWENAYIRAEHQGKDHCVQLKKEVYPGRVGCKTVLKSLAVEHLVAQNGGLLLHSSYIDHDGRGIVFTAPSGTGKSTQAALWQQLRGAQIINGDRSVLRVTEGGAYACGIPFSGSSQIRKNRTLPLAAIVYLKQAPVTTIRQLCGAEAFRRVWEGCGVNTWDRDDMAKVSDTMLQVLETVPVFELECTPDESAVLALEGVLKK